jgi:hypothetical protein
VEIPKLDERFNEVYKFSSAPGATIHSHELKGKILCKPFAPIAVQQSALLDHCKYPDILKAYYKALVQTYLPSLVQALDRFPDRYNLDVLSPVNWLLTRGDILLKYGNPSVINSIRYSFGSLQLDEGEFLFVNSILTTNFKEGDQGYLLGAYFLGDDEYYSRYSANPTQLIVSHFDLSRLTDPKWHQSQLRRSSSYINAMKKRKET